MSPPPVAQTPETMRGTGRTWSATACASAVVGALPMSKLAATVNPLRLGDLKYLVAFLPTVTSLHEMPCASNSFTRASVFLITKLLKPPHSPRSPVHTSSITLLTGRTAARGTSTSSPARRVFTANSTFTRFSEKGRPPTTASCARRTLAAATSFMAVVIFWVPETDWMRSRSACMNTPARSRQRTISTTRRAGTPPKNPP